MKWILSLVLLSGSATLSAQTAAPGCPNFSATKVLNAMRFNTPGITVLSAHRGYWEFVPENSTMAVQVGVNQCIEATEIDVRLTKDAVPVLQHDVSLERTTTGDGYINELNYAYYSGLTYLDRLSRPYLQLANQPGPVPAGTTNPPAGWPQPVAVGQAVPVQSLNQFLSVMSTNRDLILVIDAKDGNGYEGTQPVANSYQTLVTSWHAVKAWETANNLTIRNRIVWKMNITDLPGNPTTLDIDLALCGGSPCSNGDPNLTPANSKLNLVPIWFSNYDYDLAIALLCSYNQHMGASGNCAVGAPVSTTGYIWNPEVSVDYPGSRLEQTLQTYVNSGVSPKQNITAFYPASDFAEGMHLKIAECCRYRYMQPFAYGNPPTKDQLHAMTDPVTDQAPLQYTGDVQFLTSRSYNWFSGDHVLDLVTLLKAQNRRNTALISY